MRRNLSVAVLALAMLTSLLLAACGGASAPASTSTSSTSSANSAGVLDPHKKYTVNFWEAFASGALKTSLEALTKQYMQQHPNVTVTLQPFASYDVLKTKLTAAIAAGKTPALAQVYESWATKYQQSNAIVSLQPFISGKNGFSQNELTDFYPSLLKDGQINGTQYMLPFNKSDLVLYYNADVLKQLGITPPTNIQELEDDLNKVTKSDGSQWGLSLTPSSDEWAILYKAFGGGNFVSSDGKSVDFATDANAKAAKQALNELAPFVKSGSVHITKGYGWQNDFSSQKSVFALSTIASYSFLKKSIADAFQFSEAPVPAGPAGQYTVLYGTNLAIFSGVDADTQSAAWDYMKFLTGPDANAAFVQQTGYIPVRQSVYSSVLQAYYAKNPARKAGPQSLNFAFVDSTLPAWDQCRDIIGTNYTSVLSGQSTADDGLNKIAQGCNSALGQS